MQGFLLPFLYFQWHYTQGILDLLSLWRNAFWFVGNLFSVKTLFFTLLSPLKRIEEAKANPITQTTLFFENLLVNTIMRIVGACVRMLLILVALFAWVGIFLFGSGVVIFWISFPLGIFALCYFGVVFLFSYGS